MKVTLIRHGKPTWRVSGWLSPFQFSEWIKMYDTSGVLESGTIPSETITEAMEANLIVTSGLKRAIHSASLLNSNCKTIPHPLFNEVELPVLLKRNCWLKLPVFIWLFVNRLVWFLGYAQDVESYREVRNRAKAAATQLIELAEEKGHIVVVGHGWFNRLIGRELQKSGFQSRKAPAWRYWEAVTYVR